MILSFALVSTGAAILLGSLFSSEQQAGPVALLLGLGLAALGGSMVPLEVFGPAARAIAHLTPHAWANEAFTKLVKHGGDLVSVLPADRRAARLRSGDADDRGVATPASADGTLTAPSALQVNLSCVKLDAATLGEHDQPAVPVDAPTPPGPTTPAHGPAKEGIPGADAIQHGI